MHAFPFQSAHKLRYALKILVVIALAELAIMSLFHVLGLDTGPWWLGTVDALLLAVVASLAIFFWVIKPLEEAAERNQIFEQVSDSLDVGLVVTDARRANNPIVSVNPAFTRITGYSEAEVVGRNPRFLQGEDTDPETIARIGRALGEGRSIHVTQKNYRKDGSPFWNDLHIGPVHNDSGRPHFFVGLISDVTERKERELHLKKIITALQQCDEAMCTFGRDGRIEYANPAFCRNIGIAPEEVAGTLIWPLWAAVAGADEDGQTKHAYRELLAAVQAGRPWSGRHRRARLDGSEYEALTSITPVLDEDGIHTFVAVHRDITELVELEAQFAQAQKMEAVGALVGGIAHDFNNVLAGMLGNLYLVKQALEDRPREKARLQLVENQGYGAAAMIRQLLVFSRTGLIEHKTFPIKPFIKELMKFARASIPENINLRCEMDDESGQVHGDPTQLQQALLNLLTNARDAVKAKGADTGTIRISMQTIKPGDKQALPRELGEHHPLPKRTRWIHLQVADDGCGMSPETQARIFEPFFTTKPSGEGTGLGLPMVRSNIEAMGGTVLVESGEGEGTTFHVYLPCFDGEKTGHAADEAVELEPGNGELILVADDNESVCVALAQLLESANYRVITARDGDVAMRLYKEHGKDIKLVILDVIMPCATGVQVANHIHRNDKNMPILFMTAYDKEDAVVEHYLGEGAPTVISKPWDIRQLSKTLSACLVS